MLSRKLIILILMSIYNATILGVQPPKLNNPKRSTCFQNATIQALYNIQPITNFLVNSPNRYSQNPSEDKDHIAYLYTELIQKFKTQQPQSEEHYPLLKEFTNYGYTFFDNCTYDQGCKRCSHEDAAEFMTKLLDQLMYLYPGYQHFTAEKLLEEHPIAKLITIQEATTITCEAVHVARTKIRPISYLNLEVRKFQDESGTLKTVLLTTLEQCLANYFSTELLDDPQSYYRLDLTEEEKATATEEQIKLSNLQTLIPNCTKSIKIHSISEIVIIALKRFTFDTETFLRTKLTQSITIPQQINFKEFMTTDAALKNAQEYELIGAVHHWGGAEGGHYIAFVKHDNQWYECDDATITPKKWKDIAENINESYIVIYQQTPTIRKKPTPISKPSESQQELERKQQEEARRKQELRHQQEDAQGKEELKRKQEETLRTDPLIESLKNLTRALQQLQGRLS